MPLSARLPIAAFALAAGAVTALAQPLPPGIEPPPPGGFAIINRNNTGGDVNVIIPRGATGADTFMTDSAAAGNASRPELAVPNGSAGGAAGSR